MTGMASGTTPSPVQGHAQRPRNSASDPNGPEFISKTFTEHLRDRGLGHHRIPPRSPNHNAVCERFQGTAPQEFYRPAFHRQHFTRLTDLNAQFQGWLQHYNTRRPNRSDFMRGRTPTPS
jgi:transposase InsO family protein